MDESSITQNRRSRRSPVLLTATIYVAAIPVTVKLRNLSEQGALIESDRLPPEGTETFFERKDMRLKSRIVWVQGKYAGVAFDTPLKREEVLRQIPAPKQKAQQDFRRPGLACRPLSAHERNMVESWLATAQIGPFND
ncbi:MAG TPA: PilZ domain-containing protein [Sphingomicrobium sp.]|nr:PilZ domain-containing protein [Sphingomicrobium sp.]